MLPHHKSRVIEELAWHCEDPKAAYEVMTEEERNHVIKVGFVTKVLWRELQPRLIDPAPEHG